MKKSYRLIGILCLIGTFVATPVPATGMEIGFKFYYEDLTLSYTYAPDVGGKVGEVTISSSGYVKLGKYDLGGDGLGGGNDVLLDVTVIDGVGDMAFLFAADVYQEADPDHYRIEGSMTGSDVDLLTNSHEAAVLSSHVTYDAVDDTLEINGTALALLMGSPILMNRADGGNDWVFVGERVPTPGVDPDEDGVEGTVTLASNVESFDHGTFAVILTGVDVADLTDFFSEDRVADARGKLRVVPEPVSLSMLGLGGLGLLTARRRR